MFNLRNHLRRHHVAHVLGAQLGFVALLFGAVTVAAAGAAQAHLRTAGQLASAQHARPAVTRVSNTVDPRSAGEDPGVIRLRDLTPDAARLWNASNPIASGPNPAAKPFNLAAEGVMDEARAVDCMTAAIYYEAGFESLEGQRAVAQVVINRLRNPLFPKTVCGVVFQGSDRTTGCQFTFTCDGTLARKPAEEAWTRSRKVAVAALHGYVMKKVGNATHYHADYVAPYWSPTLVKVAVVGQHIFYRWTGGLGMPPAFGGRYAGGEMKGLQIATLDGLNHSVSDLSATAAHPEDAQTQPAQATVVAEAAPPPVAPDNAELVTAQAMAKDAQAMVKAEDLDWQGRPRQRGAPHIARPSDGMGPPKVGGF